MIVLRAVYVCENLIKEIEEKGCLTGKLHSVFDRACNLEAGSSLITLLSCDRIMSPMSIKLDSGREVNFKALGFEQGMKFKISTDGVFCDEMDFYASLDGAHLWSPEAKLNCRKISSLRLLNSISILETGIEKNGKLFGIGEFIGKLAEAFPKLNLLNFISSESSSVPEYIINRFIEFMLHFINYDVNDLSELANKIIGYGVGLTPSVDDFISGLMITNVYFAHYYNLPLEKFYALNREIIGLSRNSTTRVSYEMLKHSSMGWVNESLQELIGAMMCDDFDGCDIANSLKRTIDYGETSGTDTALGIYVGFKIWLSFDYGRICLNDSGCGD